MTPTSLLPTSALGSGTAQAAGPSALAHPSNEPTQAPFSEALANAGAAPISGRERPSDNAASGAPPANAATGAENDSATNGSQGPAPEATAKTAAWRHATAMASAVPVTATRDAIRASEARSRAGLGGPQTDAQTAHAATLGEWRAEGLPAEGLQPATAGDTAAEGLGGQDALATATDPAPTSGSAADATLTLAAPAAPADSASWMASLGLLVASSRAPDPSTPTPGPAADAPAPGVGSRGGPLASLGRSQSGIAVADRAARPGESTRTRGSAGLAGEPRAIADGARQATTARDGIAAAPDVVQAVQAVQPARTPQPTQALEVTSKDSVISVDPPPATAGDGQTLRSRELRSSTPSVMGGPEASPMARAAPLEVARSTEASAPTPAVVQHPGEAAGRAAGGAAAATEGLQNIAVAAAALNSASVMAPAALALGGDHVGSDDVGTDGNLVTAAAQPGTATGIDTAGVVAPSSAPLAAAGADRAGATVATHRLDAHPASLAFAAEVSTRITTFVSAGVHHARLELNPAEMGPVTVQIQLSGQAAQVHLAAESADTRRALEQSMPQLASTLRQAGLTLSGGGVFEQPRPPQQQERETGTSQARARSAAIERASAASVAPLTSAARRRGVVDLVA